MQAVIGNRVAALVGTGYNVIPLEESFGSDTKRGFSIVDGNNDQVAYFPNSAYLTDLNEADVPADFIKKVYDTTLE